MLIKLHVPSLNPGIQATVARHDCSNTDQQRTQQHAWFHQRTTFKNYTVMTTIFITVVILALYYYMYETYVRILRFGFSCRRSPLLF